MTHKMSKTYKFEIRRDGQVAVKARTGRAGGGYQWISIRLRSSLEDARLWVQLTRGVDPYTVPVHYAPGARAALAAPPASEQPRLF